MTNKKQIQKQFHFQTSRQKSSPLLTLITTALIIFGNTDSAAHIPANALYSPSPISFVQLEKMVSNPVIQDKKEGNPDEKIYDRLEEPVSWKGSNDIKGMTKFIEKNLRYPKEAIKRGEKGKVFVKFIVEKDGSITSPTVIRGISEELDDEALRIVKIMPKLNPGKIKEKAVRSYFVLPFTGNK